MTFYGKVDRSHGAVPMLLSSIIQILDQSQTNAEAVEPLRMKSSEATGIDSAGVESKSCVEGMEIEIAAEAGLTKPFDAMNLPATRPPVSPFFEELLRAIKTFQEPDPSKVLDIFK
jgi:hypothetical protein